MAGIQNKLLTGTITVIHSEKEAFVVKNTGNLKENIEKCLKSPHLTILPPQPLLRQFVSFY